jgi:hypothetical protein
MSKRGNHDGKAEHREKRYKEKAGEKDHDNVIDFESTKLMRDADKALDGIIDMANDAAAAGREDVLEKMLDIVGPLAAKLEDKWYCDQCHVAVNNKERCKHCGKTEKDLK